MLFDKYGKCKTLADPYLFAVACARAGVPLLIVAPPSGGKSTVIFAAERFLRDSGSSVERVSRIGLRGLRELTEWLKTTHAPTIINEEYSDLGSAEYMVEKLGEIIGTLSYSGSYQDHGLKIDIKIPKLGFLSGVQPLWIKTMMTQRVFSTHLREKFVRFYVLPFAPSEDVDDLEAIQILSGKTVLYPEHYGFNIPPSFTSALAFQVGKTRAIRFAPMIARELSRLLPRGQVTSALLYYATRLEFEYDFVKREITEDGFNVETNWSAYHALYWTLRRGKVQREDFMSLLGVTSIRSVERALEKGLGVGWVTSVWNSSHRIYMPSDGMIKKVALPIETVGVKKWRKKGDKQRQVTIKEHEVKGTETLEAQGTPEQQKTQANKPQ
jgi:hypothetical protein